MSHDDLTQPPRAVTRNLFAAGFVLAGFLASALIWAMGANIATTLRVPGAISPTAPSHNVQHVQGGRVAAVHVALHDHVEAGDLLFEMDMDEAHLRIATLEQSAATLRAEIAEARVRLAGKDPLAADIERQSGSAVSEVFALQDAQLLEQIAGQRAAADAARNQLAALEAQSALQDQLLAVVEARAQKTGALTAKGLAAETQHEQLQQRALQLRVSETSSLARRRALEAQIADAERQVGLMTSTRRQALGDLKLANMRRLMQIEGELALLRLRTQTARVEAPVAGQVTALPVSVAGLVSGAGATMAVISQPLEAPGIELKVPARLADQVRLGQEGLLTIDSLPQRTAPKLRVRLTQIASEPVRDEGGNAAFYTGEAELFAEDMALARETLGGRFQLAVGMPVSVALNGGDTTFWDYLTAPFAAMWDGAFED